MRKVALLTLILTFSLLTACTLFISKPEVAVKDVSVVSVDTGGATMEFYLAVKNPNPYDIKLRGYSYDLKVMALPLAKGGGRDEINFASKGETDFRIPVRISYSDLIEILKRRPNPDSIPYQLSAGLDLQTPLGDISVPVERKGTYAIPQKYRPSGILSLVTGFLK